MIRIITKILLAMSLLLPICASAESYSDLWKSYKRAQSKDLPKDQLRILKEISAKADADKNYGELLAAETYIFSLQAKLSTDSVQPELERFEKRAKEAETRDKAYAAVCYCILADAYDALKYRNEVADAEMKSRLFFSKALENPQLLARTKVDNYQRLVDKGVDSKIFDNDLLSIIGFKARDYQLLARYYAGAGNRTAALISMFYGYRQNNGSYGYYGNDGKMKNNRYLSQLDSLICEFEDLSECGAVAVERYQCMQNCSDATPALKAQFIKEARSKWGDTKYDASFYNFYRELTNPKFKAEIPDCTLPMRADSAKITVRNLKSVSIAVTRLNMESDVNLSLDNYEDWKTAEKKLDKATRKITVTQFTPEHDYDEQTKSVAIPELKPGIYVVEVFSDNSSLETKRSLLHVSNVYVATLPLPGKKTRIAVLNATTGKPIPGATVKIETGRDFKNSINQTVDSNGEATVELNDNNGFCVRAFTPDDNYMQKVSFWGSFSNYSNNVKNRRTEVFTDRAIYRPSQTVHAAAIVYDVDGLHNTNVAPNKRITFVLRDANYREIQTVEAKTDDFGIASADFVLPSEGVLNGRYCVEAKGCGNASRYFRVEEYKRPTYEVTIDEPTVEYHAGDTIKLKGHAKTYSGVPVSNAWVTYTVKRCKTHWLWRFWGYGSSSSEFLLEDTVVTDDNGEFTLLVPLKMPNDYEEETGAQEKDRRWWSMPRYYTFNVDAHVTDAVGESHDAEASVTLGTRPTVLEFSLPEKALRSSVSTVTFRRLNASGKEIDGEVTYWFDGDSANSFRTKANVAVDLDWSKIPGLQSGKHVLHAECGTDTTEHEIILFSLDDKLPVVDTPDWSYISSDVFPADGSPVCLQLGASSEMHVIYNIIAGNKVIESGSFEMCNEVKTFRMNYKEEYGEGVLLNYLWVKDGKAYAHRFTIRRPLEDKKLKLVWKTFRDNLTPGQKETWTLNVSRADFSADKINDRSRETDKSVQLLALMYDKSLDQIVKNKFSFNVNFNQNMPSTQWHTMAYNIFSVQSYLKWTEKECPDFYFNRFNYDLSGLGYWIKNEISLLSADRSGQIRGYGSAARMKLNIAPQANSMVADSYAKESYSNSVAKNFSGFAANAESEQQETEEKTSSQMQMRENLQETAFFYPALYADKNGDVSIQFTLPECVTTWKFCGMAHDKYMNSGVIQAEAVASKQVMVLPNVPRFVRNGDNATVSTLVANMTEKDLQATVRMELLDPATEKVLFSAQKKISVGANTTETASFPFVADGKYAMLICRISAQGNGYSDGEQHYLPVLPSRENVMNTAPFVFTAGGEKKISLQGLFPSTSSDRKLTVEYTANPSWLMIQALPYMAQADSKNALSLVSAYYANALGRHIMTQTPVIKRVVNLWKQEKNGNDGSLSSALEKNQELKTLVLSETPWVMDADNEAEQKKMLSTYFDESAMDYRLNEQLSALKALQNGNGSFSWWKGMVGSPSMTASVLETLARLNALTGNRTETAALIDKAMAYLGNVCVDEYKEIQVKQKKGEPVYIWNSHAIQYLYINTLLKRELPEKEKPVRDFLLSYLRKDRERNIYAKALMAVILNASGEKTEAKEYVESIKQYTVSKPGMGRYFDTNRAFYSWFDYRIPTQTAAIEAIKNVTPEDKNTLDEMRFWLLMSKQTQAWDTPINSVDAVYAFLDGNFSDLEATAGNSPKVTVAGKQCVMPTPSAGLGYSKKVVEAEVPVSGDVVIRKNDEGTSWGAVYARYTDDVKNIPSATSGLKVEREIVASENLSVGSRVKVRLTVTADRDYDFVQLVDKRAACIEPVNQVSGYCYGYYCSPKDNATNYYFDIMPKGTHVIETEYYIDRTGSYSTGTCTVQCAYAPEFAGRAAGKELSVK